MHLRIDDIGRPHVAHDKNGEEHDRERCDDDLGMGVEDLFHGTLLGKEGSFAGDLVIRAVR